MNLISVNKIMNKYIPNNIILTWKDVSIPDYIIKNIAKLNPDKHIHFFTDEQIINFLQKDYGNKYIDFFHTIKHGYNKGDFFRYCYLYKYGGYYCDIDIEHILPIDEYVDNNTNFFSVISCLTYGHIFQALLYTEPNHPIIKKCIDDMFHFGPNPSISPQYVGHTTTCMFNNIQQYTGLKLAHGYFLDQNDKKIQIGQEINKDNRQICIYNKLPIAFSRYINYTRENGFNT